MGFSSFTLLKKKERFKDEESNPQNKLAKPTIIPEAKIEYPAVRDSGVKI